MIRDTTYVQKYISSWASEDLIARINASFAKQWADSDFRISDIPSEYEVQREIQRQTGVIRSSKWRVDMPIAAAYIGNDFREVSKIVSESDYEVNLNEELPQPYSLYARHSGKISFAYAFSLISPEAVMKILSNFSDIVTIKSKSVIYDSYLLDDRAFVAIVEAVAENLEYLDYPVSWMTEIVKQ